MSIDLQLRSFRAIVRQNTKTIINHVIEANISRRAKKKKRKDICVFCSTDKGLTKEHVIPRWTYEGSEKKFFTTNINGLDQSYNKTIIPACSVCNNERLNSLEMYLNKLFSEIDLEIEYFHRSDLENIIRWLEILDYKFQILNARRLFKASKEKGYIPYLADFPITVLRPNVESPSKVVTEIRRSLKRVTTKNKNLNLNSLMVFQTSNKGFHFFHTMDEFIFIELPQHKLALFYFYKKTFSTVKKAHKAANKIIDHAY